MAGGKRQRDNPGSMSDAGTATVQPYSNPSHARHHQLQSGEVQNGFGESGTEQRRSVVGGDLCRGDVI